MVLVVHVEDVVMCLVLGVMFDVYSDSVLASAGVWYNLFLEAR